MCLVAWFHWNFLASLLQVDVPAISISAAHVGWKQQWTTSVPQDYWVSLWLMKTPTFSKAKIFSFLVNPVSAKETTSALFSIIHPSLPFKVMGLLEIKMTSFCDFKHPYRPVTLSFAMEAIPCYCTDRCFQELGIQWAETCFLSTGTLQCWLYLCCIGMNKTA